MLVLATVAIHVNCMSMTDMKLLYRLMVFVRYEILESRYIRILVTKI